MLFLAVAVLGGCSILSNPGTATWSQTKYDPESGQPVSQTIASVTNDQDPKAGLNLRVNEDGLNAGTGASQSHDDGGTSDMEFWGFIMFAGGAASLVARFWLPIIPLQGSLLFMGAGLGFVWFARATSTPSGMFIVAVVACGAAVIYAPGLIDNITKHLQIKKLKGTA